MTQVETPVPRNAITPLPPVATGVGLPWDVAVEDAVGAIAAARAAHGDTFVVESGRDRYLFTFSPTGVESFYALPEEKASKGVADYLMLRRKLPDGIFDGRRGIGWDGQPEMGWIFDSDVHGQGYAIEACRAMVDWADAHLNGQTLWAMITPGNSASVALAGKLGFREEPARNYKDEELAVFSRPLGA